MEENDTALGGDAFNGTADNSSNCAVRVRSFTDSERNFILATDVGLSSAIVLMGVVLNALSIAVLKREVRRSSMSVLLLALAIFDLTFIVLSAPYYVVYMGLGSILRDPVSGRLSLQMWLHASTAMQPLLPALWYLGNVARTGRNWIILVVALDRYMVVQNPFLSTQRSNPQRSRLYCMGVACAAALYNLPLLLEYRTQPEPCLSLDLMVSNPKRLGSAYVLVYKKLLYILLLTAGPMLCLTVLNILLIRSLLLAARLRAAITRETTRRTEETKMLVVIIALFVTTEIPGSVWHILLGTRFDKSTWFNSYLYSTGSLLTLFNSAVNFFIYCVWSRNFRRNMMYAMRRRKKPPARVIRFESDSADRGTRQLLLQQQRRELEMGNQHQREHNVQRHLQHQQQHQQNQHEHQQEDQNQNQNQHQHQHQHQLHQQHQQQQESMPMQVLRASPPISGDSGSSSSRCQKNQHQHQHQQQQVQKHLRFV